MHYSSNCICINCVRIRIDVNLIKMKQKQQQEMMLEKLMNDIVREVEYELAYNKFMLHQKEELEHVFGSQEEPVYHVNALPLCYDSD